MKGLLMIPEMARASLRPVIPKTETRRVIVPQPKTDRLRCFKGREWFDGDDDQLTCDYVTGERRCLLTTWAVAKCYDTWKPSQIPLAELTGPLRSQSFWHVGLGTERPAWAGKLRPGRFLPNHLRPLMPIYEITAVRAELLHAMREENAIAEGVTLIDGNRRRSDGLDHYSEFASLWDRINHARGYGWSVNPWVWVITFRRL